MDNRTKPVVRCGQWDNTRWLPTQPLPPPAETFQLGKWLADEIGQAMKSLREQAAVRPPIEKQPFPEYPLPQSPPARDSSPKIDAAAKEFAYELKTEPEAEEEDEEEDSTPEPPPPIDPSLFEIRNPGRLEWLDSDGLINFSGDDSEADLWRIRDASEGLLIFGAVGSGKTSGSGSAFARAFLQAGFGGLVMTAKPDEARRWLRMCQETGRGADCVHVTPGSGHKLSLLQYESQRPGDRLAVTDDLIALFRCLIGVMSRSKRSEVGDDFWSVTTNQLMRKLMDIFLLAGEPLTLDPMPFANSSCGVLLPCTFLGDRYLPLECESIPGVLIEIGGTRSDGEPDRIRLPGLRMS